MRDDWTRNLTSELHARVTDTETSLVKVKLSRDIINILIKSEISKNNYEPQECVFTTPIIRH